MDYVVHERYLAPVIVEPRVIWSTTVDIGPFEDVVKAWVRRGTRLGLKSVAHTKTWKRWRRLVRSL